VWYDVCTTILEKFVAFAEGLTEERRAAIEELLSEIMASEADCPLTPEQFTELARRMADPNPEYATTEEVEAFFARYRAA
jgi:hypothetical protein